jgi:23S rRNA pseudouridine1911/1915/1917 synthase
MQFVFLMAEPGNKLTDYNSNATESTHVEIAVPEQCGGMRFDQVLQQLLPEYSRSRLQAWIKDGKALLDGRQVSQKEKVWGGERITVETEPHPSEVAFQAEEIPLDIIYEDEAVLVLNKPAGLVVHPGSGNWQGTMLNALLHHVPALSSVPRAGIVHRLDKDTSGLLVVAKTLTAQTDLVRQLQARSVKREYFALVQGEVERDGTIEGSIGRHPIHRTKMALVDTGKPAVTHYKVIERFPGFTLVQCRLETGRTHQIRVHMQSIGHPLVGDPVYGGALKTRSETVREAVKRFGRQALHAARLGLIHPVTRESMEWQAPIPDDMQSLLGVLREMEGDD